MFTQRRIEPQTGSPTVRGAGHSYKIIYSSLSP